MSFGKEFNNSSDRNNSVNLSISSNYLSFKHISVKFEFVTDESVSMLEEMKKTEDFPQPAVSLNFDPWKTLKFGGYAFFGSFEGGHLVAK